MPCAVGLMAYNEAANVAEAVRSVLSQEGPHVRIDTVLVVASGCTDATAERARAAAEGDPRLRVLEQKTREGKASAINLFLERAAGSDPFVLAGCDTRLEPGALEALLAPFDDPQTGMTGGRPVPVNTPETLVGRIVRLLWEMHHEISLRAPKLGELVAFRSVVTTLPTDTAVDEASIESIVVGHGLRLVYVPGARVRMKGPSTLRELLAQRRRIHAGHRHLARTRGHEVSTLAPGRLLAAALAARPRGLSGWTTLAAAAGLEAAGRLLGTWDERIAGRDHHIWKTLPSSKDLSS